MIQHLITLLEQVPEPLALIVLEHNIWWGYSLSTEPTSAVTYIDKELFYSKLSKASYVGVMCAQSNKTIPGYIRWNCPLDDLTWYYRQ